MSRLLSFGGFAHGPQGVLTAVHRLALVGIELLLDSRLRIPHVGVSRELSIAVFADSEHRDVPSSLYDSELAFGHVQSLAHREGRT